MVSVTTSEVRFFCFFSFLGSDNSKFLSKSFNHVGFRSLFRTEISTCLREQFKQNETTRLYNMEFLLQSTCPVSVKFIVAFILFHI